MQVGVGLTIAFVGFYFYNQDLKKMTDEVSRLGKVVDELKQYSAILNCEFTLKI